MECVLAAGRAVIGAEGSDAVEIQCVDLLHLEVLHYFKTNQHSFKCHSPGRLARSCRLTVEPVDKRMGGMFSWQLAALKCAASLVPCHYPHPSHDRSCHCAFVRSLRSTKGVKPALTLSAYTALNSDTAAVSLAPLLVQAALQVHSGKIDSCLAESLRAWRFADRPLASSLAHSACPLEEANDLTAPAHSYSAPAGSKKGLVASSSVPAVGDTIITAVPRHTCRVALTAFTAALCCGPQALQRVKKQTSCRHGGRLDRAHHEAERARLVCDAQWVVFIYGKPGVAQRQQGQRHWKVYATRQRCIASTARDAHPARTLLSHRARGSGADHTPSACPPLPSRDGR